MSAGEYGALIVPLGDDVINQNSAAAVELVLSTRRRWLLITLTLPSPLAYIVQLVSKIHHAAAPCVSHRCSQLSALVIIRPVSNELLEHFMTHEGLVIDDAQVLNLAVYIFLPREFLRNGAMQRRVCPSQSLIFYFLLSHLDLTSRSGLSDFFIGGEWL